MIVVRTAGGCHVVAEWQLEPNEVLEHGGHPPSPRLEVKLAKVDAVNLDCTRLGVVETAEELGERRLAGAVLADDGKRRARGDGEVKVLQNGLTGRWIGERDVAAADLGGRHALGHPGTPDERTSGLHCLLETECCPNGRGGSIESP